MFGQAVYFIKMYDLQDLSVHPLPRLVRWILGYVIFLFVVNFAIVKFLNSGKTVFIDEEKYDKRRYVWVRPKLASCIYIYIYVCI